MNFGDATELSPEVTGVGMTEIHAWSDSQPSPIVDYDDYVENAETTVIAKPWIAQHWRSLVTAAEVVLSAAGFIWVVTHVPNPPPQVITLPPVTSPPTTVTQMAAPPPIIITQSAPPAVVVEPPTITTPPEETPPTSSRQLFSSADDQQLLARLQQQRITIDDNTVNNAHDACIMIQDGDRPSEVNRDTATTTGLDLYTASLLVADAQLSYPNCYKGGNER